MDITNINDHFTSGVNLLWNPMEGMNHRLNAGHRLGPAHEYFEERPWGYFYVQGGNRETDERTFRKLTLDYAGTMNQDPVRSLVVDLARRPALQRLRDRHQRPSATTLPDPGAKILQSGAITEAFEVNSTVTSGGFFLQEVIGIGDRLFLTGGLRVDGHSAFGQDFGLETYPKGSFSYVISDESLLPQRASGR